MKTFYVVLGTIAFVGLLILGLTYQQINSQYRALSSDLQYRTGLLADSLKESVEPFYIANQTKSIYQVLNKFTNRQRLLGLVVYNNKGEVVAASPGLSKEIIDSKQTLERAMDSNRSLGNFLDADGGKIYQYVEPLHQDNSVIGGLMVVQKADYIDEEISMAWRNNLLRLIAQIILSVLVVIFILRWLIWKPIVKLAESIKLSRFGKTEELENASRNDFFKPLTSEITKLSRSLFQARTAASREARMRLEKLDTPWTENRLKEFVKTYLKNRNIFVLSNREPYVHTKNNNEITYSMPASGMVTAVEPIMEACGGMWIAHGSGNADKLTADAEGKIQAPPDEPRYTLKRIWLTEEEEKGHYTGFSNEALWPLCHVSHTRPVFRKEDWVEYRRVNGKFAQTLLSEIKNIKDPIILVQDFHLAVVPRIIKNNRPDAQIGLFWHIPWPSAESFSICPWRKEILEGMLGADVVGFHTQQHCNNFMETVGKDIESVIDSEQFSITHKGHQTFIKPFPISVAFSEESDSAGEKADLSKFGIYTKYVGIGVDRMDYTKGIMERFKGIEMFLENYPTYKGQFTFLQIAPPSRESVEKYREFNEAVTDEAERINRKFSTNGWKPIVLYKKHLSHGEIYPLYRRADVCLVTSLHDGMNLVAKEFAASRDDDAGVLVLSQFAGASRDLKGALVINPYSAEQTAKSIYDALNMPKLEQRRRMQRMRQTVKDYNVYRWASEFLKAVASS